jgi:hypothetical protein
MKMENHNLTETFLFSKSTRNIILFGLIFFGGGLVLSTVMFFIEPKLVSMWWIWVPVIIGYFFFTKMCLDAWKQRGNFIKLNDVEIALYSPESKIESINWEDITDVKENNILERLVLTDKSKKTINIEYQLENITELINILTKRIPQLTNQYSQLEKFHRTNHLHLFYILFLIFFVGLIILSVNQNHYMGIIFFSIVSCLFIYLLLIEFIEVRILSDAVIIVYPFWNKETKYSNIKDVSIETIRSGNGKSSQFVLLKLKGDKIIKLNAVREGTIALYSAIKHSFQKKAS